MEKLIISPNEKVLIIAPHPDDESIGCGGLLLMYSSQCDVICISDGRQGQGDITPIKLREIREGEFIRAMESLSVNSYRMFGIEDGTLCGHLDALDSVDFTRYSKVFVTGRGDNHPDHSAAIVMVKKVLEEQNLSKVAVFEYAIHNSLDAPSHYLEIDEQIDKKIKLIRICDSQIKNVPFDERTKETNLKNGQEKHYFEVFKSVDLSTVNDDLSLETELEKSREFYWIFVRWMKLKNLGIHLADYQPIRMAAKTIIYGYKEMGKLLEEEFESGGIEIEYIMDSNKQVQVCNADKKIRMVNDAYKDADYEIPVIVTATFYYGKICDELKKKGFKWVYSLKEIIEEMEYDHYID